MIGFIFAIFIQTDHVSQGLMWKPLVNRPLLLVGERAVPVLLRKAAVTLVTTDQQRVTSDTRHCPHSTLTARL